MRRSIIKLSSFKTTSLISLPVNLGQPFLGPDKTPNQLLDNGLIKLLTSSGWKVNQLPEITCGTPINNIVTPHAKNCHQVPYIKIIYIVLL